MLTGTTVTTINLIEGKPGVTLTAYVAGTSGELAFNEERKAMLVIPGGAYAFCSDREADPLHTHILQRDLIPLFFVIPYTEREIPFGQAHLSTHPQQ